MDKGKRKQKPEPEALARVEDRRYFEGLLAGLDLARDIALLHGDDAAGARIAELMRDADRLLVRMRLQHCVPAGDLHTLQ